MKLSTFILLIFLVVSCKRKPENILQYNFSSKGVFVINEGNYTNGNASLSFIDLEADSIVNDVFFKVNKLPLGDVAQSGVILDSLLFLVVNNSGKIWVIDRYTGKYLSYIDGLPSPRYLFIKSNKGYVSDLYSPYIDIIDVRHFCKIGKIYVGRSTEKLLFYSGCLYACNWSYGNKIYKIDIATASVCDSIEVAYQPNSMVIDKNGFLWVLSDGGNMSDTSENELPALTKIDIEHFSIDTVFYFASRRYSPFRLTIDKQGEYLYWIKGSWQTQNDVISGIYKMSIYSHKLPNSPFIASQGKLFYGLAISPDGEIFVSDAKDYMQNGTIYRYNVNGKLISSYQAGIIPGHFVFNWQ